MDAKIIYWKGAAADMNADWVPGLDVAGVIDALGPGVAGWRPGDRVLYHGNMFQPHGGFAEFAIHAAATLTPHPNVPAVEAAATPCAAWTAYRSLVDKLHVQPGQSLLVIGGAGGVGSFAVQFARYLGMDPIIATCSSRNFDLVRQFGRNGRPGLSRRHGRQTCARLDRRRRRAESHRHGWIRQRS